VAAWRRATDDKDRVMQRKKSRPEQLTLGARLRAARMAVGMEQLEVAAKTTLSQPLISMYERDKSRPPIAAVRQLKRIYGVSWDELLGD